jgi:hypothetical protein
MFRFIEKHAKQLFGIIIQANASQYDKLHVTIGLPMVQLLKVKTNIALRRLRKCVQLLGMFTFFVFSYSHS